MYFAPMAPRRRALNGRPTATTHMHHASRPRRLNETGPSAGAIERGGGPEERTNATRRGRTLLLVLPADVEPIILRRQSRVGCGRRRGCSHSQADICTLSEH